MKKVIFILLLITIAGCSKPKEKLMILSGVTMRFALEELTQEFAKMHEVEFEISHGGSGSLKKLIQENKIGDIFFPGSESYITQLKETGEVIETAFVGNNQAALIVAKGNPMKIKDIHDLANPDYNIVIARADSGSIGKEASTILQAAGIEEEVLSNVLFLTTDSKDIDAAIINGNADVTINWKATSTWSQNKDYMDYIEIPQAEKKRLVFGSLTYSKNKSLAKSFIEFAATDKSREIFKKHGF